MTRRNGTFRLFHVLTATVLAAVLAFSGILPAAAAGKNEAEASSLDTIFNCWYYVPDTLPEWVEAFDNDQPITLTQIAPLKSEKPDSMEVTVVSGDEFLADAVTFGTKEYGGEQEPCVGIDNSKLTRPGHAVLHIVLESKNMRSESDREFWVLSWDEDPLVDRIEEPEGLVVPVGVELTNAELDGIGFVSHAAEIAEKINARAGKRVFTANGLPFEVDPVDRGPEIECNTVLGNPWCYSSITPLAAGNYILYSYGYVANVSISMSDIPLKVLPYRLSGPTAVRAGETVYFSVTDGEASSGRTFALSMEGEGFSFDAETGALTADENVPDGTPYTVTATPSDGETALTVSGSVVSGLRGSRTITHLELGDGFTAPIPDLDMYDRDYFYDFIYSRTTDQAAPSYIYSYAELIGNTGYSENPEMAKADYDDYLSSWPEILEQQDVDIDGHPARLVIAHVKDKAGDSCLGAVIYTRGHQAMETRVYSVPQNGTSWEDLDKITMKDLMRLAENVEYNPAQAVIRPEDGSLTITEKMTRTR